MYLVARVVSCTKSIIIVDEPESYFHPLLARSLWDDLEEHAVDKRFVYITHDIPFALSRRHAQFAVARSELTADLLPQASSLPADLVAQIFGAASFSVAASPVIFVKRGNRTATTWTYSGPGTTAPRPRSSLPVVAARSANASMFSNLVA